MLPGLTPNIGAIGAPAYHIPYSGDFSAGDDVRRTFNVEGNRKKFTISLWLELDAVGSNRCIIETAGGTGTHEFRVNSSNRIQLTKRGTGTNCDYTSTATLTLSTWYHVVLSVDTTQALSANRVKIFVDGTEGAAENTAVSQNVDLAINDNTQHRIGERTGGAEDFEGRMAEFIFVNDQQLDAANFGRTAGGVWVPKEYKGSYGTTGFLLQFADSGNLGDDTSGNGNDFTNYGVSQSTDTPTS